MAYLLDTLYEMVDRDTHSILQISRLAVGRDLNNSSRQA